MRPEMRCPARASTRIRAQGSLNSAFSTIAGTAPEADFAAVIVARRYRLPMRLARVVASLARIGGRLS